MNTCSNCFNGCTAIVTDKCIKYTGEDVPVLGIQKGDSLSYVEQALISFLVSTLNGTGIKIDIPQEIICSAVQNQLPTCGDITVVDLITALIKALCIITAQLTEIIEKTDDLQDQLEAINADFTIHCLSDVSPSSGIHTILQSVIDTFCSFVTDVTTNYVKHSEVCTLVQACMNANGNSNKAYTKMVPYTIVEYYGLLSNYPNIGDNFDATGAGQGYWEKVYICNGANNTPDKRGRAQIGATANVPGPSLSSVVNPAASPFNPVYAKGAPIGTNSVIIGTSQIPSHTHTATAVSTVDEGEGHNHASGTGTPSNPYKAFGDGGSDNFISFIYQATSAFNADDWTAKTKTNLTVATTVANANTGGGQPLSIVQPGIGCVYIMFIP